MIRKITRLLITLGAGLAGYYLGSFITNIMEITADEIRITLQVFPVIAAAMIGYSIAPRLIACSLQLIAWAECKLQIMPFQDLMGGAIGLIIGLIIATLFGKSFSAIPFIGPYIAIFVTLAMAYIGMSVGAKKKEDLLSSFTVLRFGPKEKPTKNEFKSRHKILDTSVIIDGRIADICKSGFIEGPLVIPNFVLEELRHIADSSDLLKRNRGRRGLDILNKIRKELDIPVIISDKDFEDIAEVDSKLVKLAQVLDGYVVTNDYNLNKVAELQGIKVLNINELANAVKPVVLPGEEMVVQIIKEGKESGQGIAYLDDGTMIVVENGRKVVGDTVEVLVTSVLQTAAGKMIFAKLGNEDKKEWVV